MKSLSEKRTLCDRCAPNYYDAGYEVITMPGEDAPEAIAAVDEAIGILKGEERG